MCPKVEKLMLLSHLVIFCEVLGDQCGLQGANVTLNAEYIQASGSFDSVLWARQDASGNFGDSVVFFQPPNNHVYDNRYSADKVQVVNQANNPALIIQNFGESDLDVYEARVSHDGTFRIESDLSEMVKTSDIHVISVTACGRNFNETEIRESLMCSTGDVIFSVSMIDDYNCSFEIAFKRGSDEICKEEHGNGCTPGNCNYDCTISSEGDVDITVTLDFTPSDPYEKSFQFEIEDVCVHCTPNPCINGGTCRCNEDNSDSMCGCPTGYNYSRTCDGPRNSVVVIYTVPSTLVMVVITIIAAVLIAVVVPKGKNVIRNIWIVAGLALLGITITLAVVLAVYESKEAENIVAEEKVIIYAANLVIGFVGVIAIVITAAVFTSKEKDGGKGGSNGNKPTQKPGAQTGTNTSTGQQGRDYDKEREYLRTPSKTRRHNALDPLEKTPRTENGSPKKLKQNSVGPEL